MGVSKAAEHIITEIVEQKYRIYDHYLRKRNDQSNLGWCHTMYHSIGQQIIKQDSQYYVFYVALRPNHAWRLILYPYYAKFAKPGNYTSFRYIDISILKYLETGRGGNLIQRTVAIINDDEENSTFMCLGMHKHLQE